MAIPGKTLSRMSLVLREGNTAGIPDRISATYEIFPNADPTLVSKIRKTLSYTPVNLTTFTAQALWNDILSKIETEETNNQTQIITASLPNGQVGVAYSFQLSATNFTAPLVWSNTAQYQLLGTIGLSLNTSTGLITGVPNSAIVLTPIEISIIDANNLTDKRQYTLTITV